MRELNFEFTHRGLVISDELYNSFPCPIYTRDLSDETMQTIAEEAYYDIASHYRFYCEGANKFKSIGEYVSYLLSIDECTAHEEDLYEDWDNVDADYWRFIEEEALHYGAVYYEDMSDEEYEIARNK